MATDLESDMVRAGHGQGECVEHVAHKARLNWRDNKEISKSMPEYLLQEMCAEDDWVALQRRARLLKLNQLEAVPLPPPRKFAGASRWQGFMRSRSAAYPSDARADTCHERSLRRSSCPSSCSCYSLRASFLGDGSQLHRPPSLVVMWETLMARSDTAEEGAAGIVTPEHASVAPPPTDASSGGAASEDPDKPISGEHNPLVCDAPSGGAVSAPMPPRCGAVLAT
jgi:hypothetical protein